MEWYGFLAEEFEFEGRKAIVVFPQKADEAKNWALKTEYWDAFPETEIQLLQEGFHVAYLQNTSRFAPDEDCHAKARFADFLREKYALNERCVPVGMSCGGAHALRFAALYPHKICCLFIEAPVVDFSSFPAKFEDGNGIWEGEFLKTYPTQTRESVGLFEKNPIFSLPRLVENEVPIVMSYGTDDSVVPYEENGAFVEKAYEKKRELLFVYKREGQGHHPHGFGMNREPVVAKILELFQ